MRASRWRGLRHGVAVAALAAITVPAAVSSPRPLGFASAMPLDGVVETQPCTLSAASVPQGGTLTAHGTLHNMGPRAVTLTSLVLAGRPPGGTNAGGPYDDFMPKPSERTLAPGHSYTVWAARHVTPVDPVGTWSCYLTYQTADGRWHDSPRRARFTVLAASRLQAGGLLPGQAIWGQGVSSYLFGTGDTIRWSAHNIGNDPAVWRALRQGHFTLLRTWFFKTIYGVPQTTADMDNRLQVIAKSGMQCLGVLPQWKDAAFNSSIVARLGRRCNIYEFGNEPDSGDWGSTERGPQRADPTLAEYLQQWNTQIPVLRRLNPNARFLGPACAIVTPCMTNFLKGVRTSGVWPDGLTFHLYACGDTDSGAQCVPKAHVYEDAAQQVRQWSESILGVDLPIGITEWNYNGSARPRRFGAAEQRAFVTAALTAMIHARVAIATQFDVANGGCGGACDLFDTAHTNAPTGEYYGISDLIRRFVPPT